VMDEMGKAMMGTGEAEGDNRAIEAAEKAIANPLLDEISLEGAKGVLINITGGYDLTLFELDEAANKIREKVDPEANIIVGSTLDTTMEGRMRVSVVATGIDAVVSHADMPIPRRPMSAPLRERVSAETAHARHPAPAARPTFQPAARPAAAVAAARAAEPAPARPEPRAEPRMEPRHETRAPEYRAPEYRTPEPAPAPEPTLFDEHYDDETAEDAYNTFEPPAYADDLPPPAYRPRAEARPEPRSESRPEAFVAPARPAAGTPTPEALARLRNAVNRAPTAPSAPAPAPRTAEPERSRFGLNSLINKMTGHQGDTPAAAPTRAQPQVSAAPREEAAPDPEQERIDIPAFLRRQAN
jgi:cell division protein FtsZ